MSVQHKRTSIKNKPKTVEELTAQGAELERKVSELEQSGGGASPALISSFMVSRETNGNRRCGL